MSMGHIKKQCILNHCGNFDVMTIHRLLGGKKKRKESEKIGVYACMEKDITVVSFHGRLNEILDAFTVDRLIVTSRQSVV